MIARKNNFVGFSSKTASLLCMIGILTMSLGVFADSLNIEKPNYEFNLFKLELSNNRVETIIQDSRGYMWIGTLGGLHKYDGANLTLYPTKNDTSANQWHITYNLFEDSQSRLWASTNAGIYKYDRVRDKFIHYFTNDIANDPFIKRNIVYSIIEDANSTLWICNVSGGFYYFDEKNHAFKEYFTEEGEEYMADLEFSSIARDNSNDLWLLTKKNGLIKLNSKTREITNFNTGLIDSTMISNMSNGMLMVDHDNHLWITSTEQGVYKLSIDHPELGFSHYRHEPDNPNSLYNDFVVKVYESPSKEIWLCNRNGGLHLYNEKLDNFYRYIPDTSNPYALADLAIQTIYEDQQGRLWVGSHISGVSIYDKFKHRFDNYGHSYSINSINNDIVRCFYEDKNSNVWIGTDGGGLNFFDREKGTFSAYTVSNDEKNTISSNVVLSISEDQNGMLWLGTWGGSINLYDPISQTFTQPYKDLEYVKNVYNITCDSKGRTWVGTWHEGVVVFDSQGDEIYHFVNDSNDPYSFGDIDAVFIFEDSRNNIWIGTEATGLSRVIETNEGEVKFKRYFNDPNDPNSIISNRIKHLYEDSNGYLWIASHNGVSKYVAESDHFINYNADIVDANIKSIEEDSKGNIWLGTSKGLIKFNPYKETSRYYKPNPNRVSSNFSRYAVLKSSKGELFFGGEHGFVVFEPDNFSDNTTPTKTYLTGLKVMNRDQKVSGEKSILTEHISLTNQVELTHEQSVISIGYVGINFTEANKNKYAYRMVGFDSNWQYVGDKREATYMNLKPGHYTFQVKSCNNDELWNEQYASLGITVLPPWWLTWWAKTLFAVIFIGSVLTIYLVRVFNFKRQKKLLTEEVAKRTKKLMIINEELKAYDKMVSHDLKGPIGHIFSLAQILKDDKDSFISEESKIFLDQIIKSSNASRELIDGILNFASADQPGLLVEEIDLEKQVNEAIEGHSLTIKVKQANIKVENLPSLEKGITVKVYQLFYNLIGNSLKFQEKGTKPEIAIYQQGQSSVVVEDNGIGFDQKYAEEIFKPLRRIGGYGTAYEGYGIGLGICKRIVDFHGWDIKAYSQKGKGSRFVITF